MNDTSQWTSRKYAEQAISLLAMFAEGRTIAPRACLNIASWAVGKARDVYDLEQAEKSGPCNCEEETTA